jgi:uncharacterized protein
MSDLDGIWAAAEEGDLAEVERLVGHDPGLLNARHSFGDMTPLMYASSNGHVGVVRWLLDRGAAMNERNPYEGTALWYACREGRAPVVRLLLQRGADPTIATQRGSTPLLIAAASENRLEVLRLLLGNPSTRATINHRDVEGQTALWWACYAGRGGSVRALLEAGADPTVADNDGITPMAIAKEQLHPHRRTSAEGRRECVAALEVSLLVHISIFLPYQQLF